MAEIDFDADKEAESVGGGGGGAQFSPAPMGIYTLQIADHTDGERTQGGKNPGTPITKMTCEIADDGEHFGKRVWSNVTWIPRGTGGKANAGHGMAVHFLHAVGLPFDGKFKLNESELQGRTFRALLGITTYDKVVNGRTYTNEKNFIEQVYTDEHPAPDVLPPPRIPKKQATISDPNLTRGAGGAARSNPGDADWTVEEPVPF